MSTHEVTLHLLIIPTIVLPFAALLAGLSVSATFVAALFGVKLKAEGPKKWLEILLKPRVLLFALVSNFVIIGGYQGYRYWKNAPIALWRIERTQRNIARPSESTYSNVADEPATQAHLPPGKIEVVWTRALEDGSFRGALVAGDTAFVGTDAGWVHEINIADGATRRRFFTGTAVSAVPFLHQGSLYVGEGLHDTHHARLYRFDLATGGLAATYTSKGHIEGETTAGTWQGTEAVFVPSGVDGLAALDAKTLAPLWHAREGHVDSAARAVDGVVFSATGLEKENVGGARPSASAYRLASGEKIWQQELPASSWMRPVSWQDKICFVFGEVYFPSNLGGVYCFLRSDGQPDVAFNNGAPIVSEPILLGDDLVVADLKGKVCRVSLGAGRARWCRETGPAKSAFTNAAMDARLGVLVYPSATEGLFVLDPDSGAVLAQWKGDGEAHPWAKTYAPAAVVKDGWIVVDMKGVMRKLRWSVESSAQAAVP